MDNTENKLIGKTITEAEVDGYGIRLILDDEYVFVYNASDGGYSTFDILMVKDVPKYILSFCTTAKKEKVN